MYFQTLPRLHGALQCSLCSHWNSPTLFSPSRWGHCAESLTRKNTEINWHTVPYNQHCIADLLIWWAKDALFSCTTTIIKRSWSFLAITTKLFLFAVFCDHKQIVHVVWTLHWQGLAFAFHSLVTFPPFTCFLFSAAHNAVNLSTHSLVRVCIDGNFKVIFFFWARSSNPTLPWQYYLY